MATNPKPDTALAEQTVRMLSQTLRTQQFMVHRQRKMNTDSGPTEASIRHLARRIRWEMQKNPGLYAVFGLEDLS